ncbi:hypothetical protein GQ600_11560 [Phytophthora cactorum]|nr:hypothetical protein GQ600_11560 [Phytophthora cactorum]
MLRRNNGGCVKLLAVGLFLLEQFQDLMNQRIDESDDLSSSEDIDTRAPSYQHKRVRLEPTDDAIFSAYIDELDGVYTQTDEALRVRG